MGGKRVVSEWLTVNPSLLLLPYRAELERLIDEELRAVEEEHKDVEWWSVWALEHDWLPPHDAQRLTAEVARLRTRSALQAADYTALVEALQFIESAALFHPVQTWESEMKAQLRRIGKLAHDVLTPTTPRQEGTGHE